MAFAPSGEQAAFARAHPDLYSFRAGRARLSIAGGGLRLSSLACAGFAVAAGTDFSAMRPMPAPPAECVLPRTPPGRDAADDRQRQSP